MRSPKLTQARNSKKAHLAKMDSELYIDPKCECDAPRFVDFANMTSQYEDHADDWFDQRGDLVIAESMFQEEEGSKFADMDSAASTSHHNEVGDEYSTGGGPESHIQVEVKCEGKSGSSYSSDIVDETTGSTRQNTSVRKAMKSTEQRQMEEIRRLQFEAKKRLKASRQSFHRLAKGSRQIKPVKGSKRPTQIKEFNFSKAVDKSHAAMASGDGPIDFAKTLRSMHQSDNFDPSMAPKKPPTPDQVTRPKPFKFELDKRPGLRSSGTNRSKQEVPVAEFIAKFETATPPRFRRTPTNRKTPGGNGKDKNNYSLGSHLTNPKTPQLLTKTRARPVQHKSIAELEEEAALKMKQYQFKANPLNPDIIHKGGLLGVPRKRTNPSLTHPVSPQLATKKMAVARKALHGEEDQPDYEAEDRRFIATPMPDFNEIKGLPTKRPRPVTQPETPIITKHCRLTKAKGEEEESHSIKANPMPNFEKVFAPQYPQRMVETQPFSFEERDKGKTTGEEKILQSGKVPGFKAQPLPSSTFQPSFVPTLDTSVTKPSPFNLQTDIRGEQHSLKWKEQIDKQLQKEKEDADFKAGDVSARLYSRPFSPERSTKPLTRVENVILHSELRSSRRAKYECEKQKRIHLLETENLARRALREAQDAKNIAAYRKSLVHKAKPINHYAPLIVKPSSKPVTQPISPKFTVDQSLKNKLFTK